MKKIDDFMKKHSIAVVILFYVEITILTLIYINSIK